MEPSLIFVKLLVLLLIYNTPYALGLGCIPQLCDDNPGNIIANSDCKTFKDHCGAYKGKRFDNSLLRGIDVECKPHSLIYAPFNGTLSFHRPRGGQKDTECIDQGIKIQGLGKWAGYTAIISYIKPIKYNGRVEQGSIIGTSLDLSCASNLAGNQKPHILFQLLFQGRYVDPTNRVLECMCTGQICSSNSINEIVGLPFKHKPSFGKGFELTCGNTREAEDSEEVVPEIYNPIEASFLGRFRPRNITKNETFSCDNDGVFLTGTGKWSDFVVHIYNVIFLMEPGNRYIAQGAPIARRLTCPDQNINTIFIEFRFNGRLVNVTNLITAQDCKVPQLPD